MFPGAVIMAALALKLISCSGHTSEEEDTASKSSANKRPQCRLLQTLFRLSRSSFMFYDACGIPYQYHIPRVNLILEDRNNGCIKVSMKEYPSSNNKQANTAGDNKPTGSSAPVGNNGQDPGSKFSWRLAASTRELTALEQKNAGLWKRDPVPMNRLMLSLESPIFLGNFFYALTSVTEANGTTILSRFYYAPVLTARRGTNRCNSNGSAASDMELSVFSICIEPSDAPEDVSIPLMHRPQRIIDVGLRNSSHNAAYDAGEKLRENSTAKLNEAEHQFANASWDTFFADLSLMTFRQLPKENSPYATIRTSFGNYVNDGLGLHGLWWSAFHGYDFQNDAYMFAYGPGDRHGFTYSVGDAKLLIFLNPRAHFKNENKMWDMCVDLWREEMRARYGTDSNSRLVHPHAYLSESASTAPFFKMLPRYEAMGKLRNNKLLKSASARRRPAKPPGSSISSSLDPPCKRYPLQSVLPGLSESTSSWFQNIVEYSGEPSLPDSEPGSTGIWPELGAGCSTDLCSLGTSSLDNDVSSSGYWASRLPSLASRSATEASMNEQAALSPDSCRATDSMLGAEPACPNPFVSGLPSCPTSNSVAPDGITIFQQPDNMIALAITMMLLQQLVTVTNRSANQSPVDTASSTGTPTLPHYADPVVWNDPALLSLLASPTTFSTLLSYLEANNSQANRQ